MKLQISAALLALVIASSAPHAQQSADAARVEQFKSTVLAGVEARGKLAQVINDTVFSFGELAYQEFYEDPSWLQTLASLEAQSTSAEEIRILQSWQRMFRSSVIEDENTRAFSRELLKMQLEYDARRGKYEWGYTDPHSGQWVSSTSNTVPNILIMSEDEPTRKAAFEGKTVGVREEGQRG